MYINRPLGSICYLFHFLIILLCPYSTIHISRKSWHTLLNTCFHIAMTTAIYAGGISLTSYPVVCQAVSTEFTQIPYFFYYWHVSLMSDLTAMRDRWALLCTTRHCRPCCGSESVPGSSTKRLCGDCRGSWRESLQLHRLSDLCSGQGACHNLPSPY